MDKILLSKNKKQLLNLHRVNVVIHRYSTVSWLSTICKLQIVQYLVYFVLRETALDLEHNAAYVLLFYPCYRWQVGTQYAVIEDLAHTPADDSGELFKDLHVAVLHIYVNQPVKRRIMEKHTFANLLVIECSVVVAHNHGNYRGIGHLCL